ncbi:MULTISPECIES: TRAP transporter substrate-binding protein [Pseudonocardia]
MGAIAAVGGLTACSSAAPLAGRSEYTITVGHPSQSDHFHVASFNHFKDLVEERSSGRIAVRFYPDGIFGGDRETIESVQMRYLQLGFSPSSSVAAFVPQMSIWDVPFLFDSLEHAYATLDSPFGQRILAETREFNMLGLGYWDNGFRHLSTRATKVESLADLRGLSVRVLENPVHIRAWRSVGANPTPMAFGEVYVGLQQGTIDAQENALPNIETARFYEVQRYVMLTQHIYGPQPFYINTDFFEDLPEDLQEVVVSSELDARQVCRDRSQGADEQATRTISESGSEIVELTPDQRAEFAEPMQEGAEAYLRGVVGEELIDELHDVVREYA